MLRDRPVRALTVGNLNIVCGIVTLLTVQTNFHHRSCARCAQTFRATFFTFCVQLGQTFRV